MTATEVANLLGLTQPAVSKAVQRGEKIAHKDHLKLEEQKEFYNFMPVPLIS